MITLSVTGTREGYGDVVASLQIEQVAAHERRHILTLGRMFDVINTATLSQDDNSVVIKRQKNGWFVDGKKLCDLSDTLTAQAKKDGLSLSDQTRDSGPDLSVAYNAAAKAHFPDIKPRSTGGRTTIKEMQGRLDAVWASFAAQAEKVARLENPDADDDTIAGIVAAEVEQARANAANAASQKAAADKARVGDKINASEVPSRTS